jgi:hypothetical protein
MNYVNLSNVYQVKPCVYQYQLCFIINIILFGQCQAVIVHPVPK